MATTKRTVSIGVDKLYVAKMISDDAAGQLPSYDAPKHFPGVRKIGVTVRNQSTSWYDDNQLFGVFNKTEGGDVSIEKSMLSNEEYAYLMNQELTGEGEIEDNVGKSIPYFALMYRRKLDGKTADDRERYMYVTLYKWRPTRPNESTQGQENQTTPQPDVINGTTMPLESRPGHWRRFGDNANEGFTKQKEEEYFDEVKLPA